MKHIKSRKYRKSRNKNVDVIGNKEFTEPGYNRWKKEREEETVKEVIVSESLKFVTDLLVVTVIETLIVQSAYVPTLKVFKVMVLLREIAEVVLEEQEPT